MRATLPRALSTTLALVLAVLLSTASAAGELDLGETPTRAGFGLELEQTFARGKYLATDDGEGPVEAGTRHEGTRQDAQVTQLDPRLDPRGSVVERAQRGENLYRATANPELPRKRGGFGRWLKRHWWVPVLVGVAAGVVIADNDSGDDDEED